jgi:histone-lysine N-methyltransferase SETD8
MKRGREDEVEVRDVPDKGKGVFAKVEIERGTILFPYQGELISTQEAVLREENAANEGRTGDYVFWFRNASGKKMCIDATNSTHISRYLNHSRKKPDVKAVLDQTGAIVFKTIRRVAVDEEMLFDYGDRRKDVVDDHPWLRE